MARIIKCRESFHLKFHLFKETKWRRETLNLFPTEDQSTLNYKIYEHWYFKTSKYILCWHMIVRSNTFSPRDGYVTPRSLPNLTLFYCFILAPVTWRGNTLSSIYITRQWRQNIHSLQYGQRVILKWKRRLVKYP